MQYLLDTNIYINFYDRAYRFEYFPSFWDAFEKVLNQYVVLPKIVVEETNKSDEFKKWLEDNFKGEYLNHKDYAEEWGQIIQHIAQHPCYSDKALIDPRSWTHEKIADGWLIAIAKKDGLTLVTDERANPTLNAQNPSGAAKIPDIAKDFGIKCITMNEFFKEIGFKL
ncbi:DUF4411 family protein [Aggregatibacter aphrophilus]|jgi:hypothetical protein|uniref:DUF4411 family protein n=1 Tax=Aggregatibacter aphrophilus TaxID=732 RepID=UPI00194FB37E|nr:DUF4411 family protein [Aggregatibacter aphrophilus]